MIKKGNFALIQIIAMSILPMRFPILSTIILILFFCQSGICQETRQKDSNILIPEWQNFSREGIPIAKITCLRKNSQFLWIGTENGLYRWNGTTSRIYNATGLQTILNPRVRGLLEDEEKNLWVFTSKSISKISDNQIVKQVTLDYTVGRALALYKDKRSLIYASVSGEINIYDIEKDSTFSLEGFPDMSYKKFEISNRGKIIALPIWESSFYYLNNLQDTIVKQVSLPNNHNIYDIVDFKGRIILATDHGLKFYKEGNQELIPDSDSQIPTFLSSANILSIVPTENGKLLLCVKDTGLYSYDLLTDRLQLINQDQLWEGVQEVNTLLDDDVLWISPNGNGLQNLSLNHLDDIIPSIKRTDGESMLKIHKLQSKNDFLAFTNKRFLLYKSEENKYVDVTPSELKNLPVLDKPFINEHLHVWIFSDEFHLLSFHWNGEMFVKDFQTTTRKSVCMWSDDKDKLHMVQNKNLLIIDQQGEIIKKELDLGNHKVWKAEPGLDGKIYLLSSKKIFVFSEEKMDVSPFDLNLEKVNSITETSDGNFWITDRSNNFYYLSKSKELKKVASLPNVEESILISPTKDKADNLWLCYPNNIFVRLDKKLLTAEVMDYGNDGKNVDNTNGILLDGDLVLFYTDRPYLVDSEMFSKHLDTPIKVIIDGIFNGYTAKNIDEKGICNLKSDENRFTIHYSSTFQPKGQTYMYKYMLKGYDQDWTLAGQIQQAEFSHIPSGTYTFQVKICNSEGNDLSDLSEISINVHAHPLLSTPAICIYLLIFFLILYFLYGILRRIRQSKKKAQLLEQEKKWSNYIHQQNREFFENISHQYRTPLSLIYSPVQELRAEKGLSDRAKYLVNLVSNNVDLLMHLTEKALRYSKDVSEKTIIHIRNRSITGMVSPLVNDFSNAMKEKGQECVCHFDDSIYAFCNPELVENILLNLISNAIKYTPEGGKIEVKTALLSSEEAEQASQGNLPQDYTGNYVAITVQDNGIGISPEKISQIFQRYERLNESDSEIPGFGIGLNYSITLALAHRGRLFVEPQALGSKFIFIFPQDEAAYLNDDKFSVWDDKNTIVEDVKDEDTYIPEENPADEPKQKLLLVEDNAQLREYLHHTLSPRFHVITSSDGEEAWERLLMADIDIIVSDVVMPRKDGIQLCHDVKNNSQICHIPFVFLTARKEIEHKLEGIKTGADAYIQKPFELSIFIETLDNLLENRKRIQRFFSTSLGLSKENSAKMNIPVEASSINPLDKQFLDNLYNFFESEIKNEELDVNKFCEKLNMSRSGLFAKVKALTGDSPQSLMLSYRLNRSLELLQTKKYSISEVAYMVGFSLPSSFSRAFKRKFGYSPSSFTNQC